MAEVKTKFIILSAPRSGFTALTRMLNTHPDVCCHGLPLFRNARHASGLRPEAAAALDLSKVEADPLAFCHDVLDFSHGPKAVGFKIWHNGDPARTALVDALVADPSIKKIILRRQNELAGYSSERLANMSRNRPELFIDPSAPPRAHFNPDRFRTFVKTRQGWFDRYRAKMRGDVIFIDYKDLMKDGPNRIAAFLGLSPHEFVPQTLKRNTSEVLKRFKPSQHNLIRTTLDDIERPKWVREGPRPAPKGAKGGKPPAGAKRKPAPNPKAKPPKRFANADAMKRHQAKANSAKKAGPKRAPKRPPPPPMPMYRRILRKIKRILGLQPPPKQRR